MLITKIKDTLKISEMIEDRRVFVFKCFGCKEVFFPDEEIEVLIKKHSKALMGIARIDYLCREEFARNYISFFSGGIKQAAYILVFSCGVGVQVVSSLLEDKIVLPGCDTHYLKGFQGITAQDVDCQQCGMCWLNITGGICPVTACAKGLLNGPCGGANNKGKCEVSPTLDCGWILIYNRLKEIREKERFIGSEINIRDYSTITQRTSMLGNQKKRMK